MESSTEISLSFSDCCCYKCLYHKAREYKFLDEYHSWNCVWFNFWLASEAIPPPFALCDCRRRNDSALPDCVVNRITEYHSDNRFQSGSSELTVGSKSANCQFIFNAVMDVL